MQAIAGTFNVDPTELFLKAKPAPKTPPVAFLRRMRSGAELCAIVGGAHMYQHDHEQPGSADAMERVGRFLQEAHDVGDLWSDIEPGERVRTAYAMGESVAELEAQGWVIYAARAPRMFKSVDLAPMRLDVAIVMVARHDNPRVVGRGTEAEALPVTWVN